MKISNIMVITLAIALLSCSSVRVLDTDADPAFNISQYKTFDFFKLEGMGDTTARFEESADLVKAAIGRELQSRGMRQVSDSPDLLINVGIMVEEKIQTRQTNIRDAPRYIGQRNYSWKSEEIEVGRYREGTVTVHLVEPSSKKMVWKGAVAGTIPRKKEKVQATIEEGIKTLFEKL